TANNAGDDTIDGGGDDDVIVGDVAAFSGGAAFLNGAGNDKLMGGDGNDIIYGDSTDLTEADGGMDTPAGGGGQDIMYGGAGDDTMIGGGGYDTMTGGDGEDTYFWDLDDIEPCMITEGGSGDGSIIFSKDTPNHPEDLYEWTPGFSLWFDGSEHELGFY